VENRTALDETNDRPYGVLELVNIVAKEVEIPQFGTMPLDTGETLVHASVSRSRAACGIEKRRVIPTGWLWIDEQNDRYPRCAACLELYPMPDSN
jgi:hypothetical protein